MPFNKPLLFRPTELGHITQFPTFDTGQSGKYTPNLMKNFWNNINHSSASDSALKKLTRTILTESNTIRISDAGNTDRFFSINDSLSVDHLLKPSFFVDKFRESFGELGFYIQCLGNFFACFLLAKYIIFVVINLRRIATRKVSCATFGFVRTMLGATFHLIILSLQTLVYETDDNKNIGNLRMQNAKGNETLAAPMYTGILNQLHPREHL